MREKDAAMHEAFKMRLEKSLWATWTVGLWLHHSRGWGVRYPPYTVAETAGDWKKHSDSGDLWVKSSSDALEMRFEVKHIVGAGEFTNAEDWPWPRMFVCSKQSFERAEVKASTFFQVNRNLTHTASLQVERTREHWYEFEMVDRKRGHKEIVYAVDPTHALYWDIELPRYPNHEEEKT